MLRHIFKKKHLELGVPRNTFATCPGFFRKLAKGNNSKILMPELWILYMTLPLTKVYPYMKFHFNSISRTCKTSFWPLDS